MALERKFFFGFQTGGEEEFHAVTASGSIQTSPATWSDKESNYCYRLTWKQQLFAPVTYDGLAGRTTFSFHIRFENADQPQTTTFYQIKDLSGVLGWHLQVLGGFPGSFEIIGANGYSYGILYNFFENDKWYRITVKYLLSRSSLPIRVWAVPAEQRDNGAPVFSLSSFAARGAGATSIANNILMNNGWSAGIPAAIFIGSTYCFTETEDDIDTERILGAFVTLLFNDTDQGATAQFGGNLDAGRWDNTADVPVVDADVASYIVRLLKSGGVSADDGSNNGPLGQSDVDGRLLQRLGIWRAKKVLAKGNNWDFDFVGKMGGDPTPTSDGTTSVSFGALGTSFAVFTHYQTISEPVTVAGQYSQLGFGMENDVCSAGEAQCDSTNTLYSVSGMWMEMLHEEPRLLIVDGKSQLIGA